MNLFKKMFTKKNSSSPAADPQTKSFSHVFSPLSRGFAAPHSSRLLDWALSYGKIDGDLKYSLPVMVRQARSLSINNEFISGYLKNLSRNVLGSDGFALQSKAPAEFKSKVKNLWLEYQSKAGKYLTLDEKTSGTDFDRLVLRTLIVDGEVFIRKVTDPTSKFLYRYEILDSLEVDPYYNLSETADGGRISMGVRLDAQGREVSFFINHTQDDFYQTGTKVEVPADEIIHIYEKHFPNQTRGYTAFAAAILNLGHLDAYKEAELVHARIQACTMAVWEYNGQNTGGDGLGGEQTDDQGQFVKEIKPGIFPVAPRGYSAKFLQQSSPNNQFGIFWKNMLRSISNALGLSYNKASGDYESVNYSSLREATLEDRASFQELQNFLIENWKEVEYAGFIRAVALGNLVPGCYYADLLPHKFFGRRFPWVDPAKEVASTEKEFDLLLTDPITELEKRGIDPVECMDRWALWYKMAADRGIPFMNRPPIQILEIQNEGNDNANQDQSGH